MSKRQLNFEKSLERLEVIVSDMEKADLDLDKSLALFAEGSKLVKLCSKKLNETKKKIEIITSSRKIELFKEQGFEEKN
ncbi:MAG: exodeoxyribonuclease VII small subunit [Endomicrobium sp.]|jgi:exodeoxyribonuclease VII small subunit|nr:exodeoxyribonuclease VII small subunit [Endomicrobium sp.]